MSEPFLGEIRMFGFGFPPNGWALCNGQIMNISQNQALFAILGTTYGGNGQTTFALPDLRGRVPVHVGNGVTLGQAAGEEKHTLTVGEMPAHMHIVNGSSATANQGAALNNNFATQVANPFSTHTPDVQMNPAGMSTAGQSQAHDNMQPYLTINYCIALVGIFPSRN